MKKRMTLKQFIEKYKRDLDEHIQNTSPGSPRTNTERELWVLNDSTLYNWARSEGARI